MASAHPLRFGIVGTGTWSSSSHIPAATASDRVEFAGAIGRDANFEAFLDGVDAIGFAVPPDVQARFALRAVAAGKHVLLDKPIALDLDQAETLARNVEDAGLASIVFLTRRFIPTVADWLDGLAANGCWTYGRAELLSAALADMPSPGWRREYGGLWDVGPHALSLLCAVLGPVASVSAVRDANGLVTVTMNHDGATSTMATSISVSRAGAGDSILFVGEAGRSEAPELDATTGDPSAAYGRAIAALVDQVEGTAHGHPSDARFGAEIVWVLDAAERSIDSGRRIEIA